MIITNIYIYDKFDLETDGAEFLKMEEIIWVEEMVPGWKLNPHCQQQVLGAFEDVDVGTACSQHIFCFLYILESKWQFFNRENADKRSNLGGSSVETPQLFHVFSIVFLKRNRRNS